jgi:hypothetical protein
VSGEGGQNDSTRATTPDGQAGMKTVVPSPTCDVPALLCAFRMVRFTRSMKAVFNLPEKPNPCKAILRASSVPRRITCVTRMSLRQRSALFHLAVDQAHRHLPPEDFAPSAIHLAPVSKMGRQRIEVEIEPVTGEEREAERRPGSLAACG